MFLAIVVLLKDLPSFWAREQIQTAPKSKEDKLSGFFDDKITTTTTTRKSSAGFYDTWVMKGLKLF